MINEMKDLGITERESKTYIALLELGTSTVGPICKKTGIPSSKIYEILNKLIKKGFVSYIIKGKIKHYQASDPKTLINYIEEKKKKMEEILPKLEAKQKFSSEQKAEIFEGKKALFSLFTNLIENAKPKEPYLVLAMSEESKDEEVDLFLRNLTLRRKEKKLDTKLLKNIKDYVKEKNTKLKLRYTSFNLPQGITIFRDSVIITSWAGTPSAIKIESKDFAKQWKDFFLELWDKAKS